MNIGCRLKLTIAVLFVVFGAAGCRPVPTDGVKAATTLPHVIYHTDWLPQGELSGDYQSLAKGFYRDAGIEVKIVEGGAGADAGRAILAEIADVSVANSDDIMVAIDNHAPLLIVGAYMEHTPQSVMVHAESSIRTFADLDGKTVIASFGVGWIPFVQSKFHVQFNIIPMNYGLAQFMADPKLSQQCFATNEPIYVNMKGVKTRTLFFSDDDFSPYRVYFCKKSYARDHPAQLRAFLAASIRGWRDFVKNGPEPAKSLLLKLNPDLSEAFLTRSLEVMKLGRFVEGDPQKGEFVGKMSRARFERTRLTLQRLGILKNHLPLESMVSFDYAPADCVVQ